MHSQPSLPFRALILGCLVLLLSHCTQTEMGTTKKNQEKKPVQVHVFQPQTQTIFEPLTFSGFIEAQHKEYLYSPIDGHILKLHQSIGHTITANQAVISIAQDSMGFEYKPFLLTAPSTGTLLELLKEPSQKVLKGEKVALLAPLNRFKVEVQASHRDLHHLQVGLEVQVEIPSLEQNTTIPTKGWIETIAPIAHAKTHTFPIVINLQCESICLQQIKAQTLATVNLKINQRQGILIATQFLHNQLSQVYSVDSEGRCQYHDIKTGQLFADKVEITEGITPQMQIISFYSRKPDQHEAVTILESSAPVTQKKESSQQKGS